MLFNSFTFMVFLPVVFAGYWLLHRHLRLQNLLIVVASYVFYGWWDARFLILIAACSAVNYLAGAAIYASRRRWVRRLLLALCCAVSLGTLGVFKYFDFFAESFAALCALVGLNCRPWILNLALPVGISFFTFQALSYTLDIADGRLRPTADWVEFFAFISFFPQLVAGPIERATNLLPQFQKPRRFDFDAATHGLCLMAFGLFKKMVVADTLSQYVDQVWTHAPLYGSLSCALAAAFFAMQIYCDFSGYSDVARGVAQLFGFELMLNFDSPYRATSFSDFWRRWHISLSSWFRDYVYIPLGGSRVSFPKVIRNIWIVFLLSGLWHGASWAFVLWGALHAAYLTLGAVRRKFAGAPTGGFGAKALSIAVVDAGVVFAWIFFRAGSIGAAKDYLAVLFSGRLNASLMAICAGLGPMQFGFCLVAAGLFLACALLPRDCAFHRVRARYLFIVAAVAAIVLIGMPSGGEFIYFRF